MHTSLSHAKEAAQKMFTLSILVIAIKIFSYDIFVVSLLPVYSSLDLRESIALSAYCLEVWFASTVHRRLPTRLER
jgi:hypothetical protein